MPLFYHFWPGKASAVFRGGLQRVIQGFSGNYLSAKKSYAFMHPFLRPYIAKISEILKSFGFSRKGTYFYRLAGNVYQDMALKCYLDGIRYEVTYGLFPIRSIAMEPPPAYGTTLQPYSSTFPLALLTAAELPSYVDMSDTAYQDCAASLGELVKLYLIPVFERNVTTESAYDEWTRFELRQKNSVDFIPYLRDSIQMFGLISIPRINMALELGYYDTALIGLEQQIEIDRRGYGDNVASYRELLERITARDLDYIQQRLSKNAEKTLHTLSVLGLSVE